MSAPCHSIPALSSNQVGHIARRHLDGAAKRVLIEAELKDNPARSNRQVAAELGVDHKTVGSVRDEVQSIGEIPQSNRVERKGGGTYPSTRSPRITRIQLGADADDAVRAAGNDIRDRQTDKAGR